MHAKYLIIYWAKNHDQRCAGDHTSWSGGFTGVFRIPRLRNVLCTCQQ